MPRTSSSSAPRLTLAQSIVAVENGDLTAWRVLLRYDTSMLDETSGYHETFVEHFILHGSKFFEKRGDFDAAVEEIIRANKEARRAPIGADISFDDLFKELVEEECVAVIKHVVRHYVDETNASAIASALLKSLSHAKPEERGDIFLALPTSAEFDVKELFPKIVTNGGAKQLAEVVDKVGVNFEKHEILIGLGAALGVAEEKDRGTIMSLIGTVSTDGFDLRAETSGKRKPPPPPKKSVGGSSSAAPAAASATADLDDEEGNESGESGDEGEQPKKARKEKRKLKSDGKGGFMRPMGRAPKDGNGKEKTWDARRGEWM